MSRRLVLTLILVCPSLFWAPVAFADFTGLDGNTIEVRHQQATYDKIKDQMIADQSRLKG